jgi:hypothetical protein
MIGPQAPPGKERTGPVGRNRPSAKNIDRDADTVSVSPADDVVGQLRRRRAASRRLPALCCGHRDPSDCLVRPAGPSDFGLSPEELGREAERLRAGGWDIAEVAAVLTIEAVSS